MLTIFSIPKPFTGHIGNIQRNAIQSWVRLRPACEIILFGNDEGAMEVSREFGVRHIPEVAHNEYGTPLLNSVFDQVERVASHRLICYVNADIILLSDFVQAVKRISKFQLFLMVGQRWDVDVAGPVDFNRPDWEERLRRYVADSGVLRPPAGSDYFVFPQDGAIGRLPCFTVGRSGWDNWFIYNARKSRVPVVDVTRVVTVIHQNHDYGHIPNATGEKRQGPESKMNIDLISGQEKIFTLQDATWILTPYGLRRPEWTRKHVSRVMKTLPILHPHVRAVAFVGEALWGRMRKMFKESQY